MIDLFHKLLAKLNDYYVFLFFCFCQNF